MKKNTVITDYKNSLYSRPFPVFMDVDLSECELIEKARARYALIFKGKEEYRKDDDIIELHEEFKIICKQFEVSGSLNDEQRTKISRDLNGITGIIIVIDSDIRKEEQAQDRELISRV